MGNSGSGFIPLFSEVFSCFHERSVFVCCVNRAAECRRIFGIEVIVFLVMEKDKPKQTLFISFKKLVMINARCRKRLNHKSVTVYRQHQQVNVCLQPVSTIEFSSS